MQKWFNVFLLLGMLIPLCAFSQENSTQNMQMPTTVMINDQLKVFVGAWNGKGTMKTTKDNQELAWTERSTILPILDNKFLFMESVASPDSNGKVFQGKGFLTYNPQNDTYLMYWFDTDGFNGEFIGRKEGIVIKFMHAESNGRKMLMDMTIDSDTQYRLLLREGTAPNDLKEIMTTTYTKVTDSNSPPQNTDKAPYSY